MHWQDSLIRMFEEDLGTGDLTTDAVIPFDLNLEAKIISQEAGVAAGLEEAGWLFKHYGVQVKPLVKDGGKVKKGEALLSVKGNARIILKLERTALNLIGRMSGIATLTAQAVSVARKTNKKIRVAGTRKTVLRYFDKKAVIVGGGEPHRWGLYDMVLIKTTHTKLAGGVRNAVELARALVGKTRKIEVEVKNSLEAVQAAETGADIVMLDNFSHKEIERAIKLLKGAKLREEVAIELSGGITVENLKDYAKHDCEFISMGCLTHSPKFIQVALRVQGMK